MTTFRSRIIEREPLRELSSIYVVQKGLVCETDDGKIRSIFWAMHDVVGHSHPSLRKSAD